FRGAQLDICTELKGRGPWEVQNGLKPSFQPACDYKNKRLITDNLIYSFLKNYETHFSPINSTSTKLFVQSHRMKKLKMMVMKKIGKLKFKIKIKRSKYKFNYLTCHVNREIKNYFSLNEWI
ncbi:hypothetical protein BpHYR1_047444, partial [Brachionus plicatilis]